jgi:hypothetical protein
MRLLAWFMGLTAVLTLARPTSAQAQAPTTAALVGTWVQQSGFGCGDGSTCKSVRTMVLRPDTIFTYAFGSGRPDSGEWAITGDTLDLEYTKIKVTLEEPQLKVWRMSKDKTTGKNDKEVLFMVFTRKK